MLGTFTEIHSTNRRSWRTSRVRDRPDAVRGNFSTPTATDLDLARTWQPADRATVGPGSCRGRKPYPMIWLATVSSGSARLMVTVGDIVSIMTREVEAEVYAQGHPGRRHRHRRRGAIMFPPCILTWTVAVTR